MSKDIKAPSIVKHKQIDVENVKTIMRKEYQFFKKELRNAMKKLT
jgi:hypothetical protein